MGFETVRTYISGSQAHVDCDYLKANGVYAIVADENAIGSDGLLLGAVGYAKVQVNPENLGQARQLLDDLYKHAETAGDADPAGSADDWPKCPQCGSTNITEYAPYAWSVVFPLLFPLLFIKRKACGACNHSWK